MYLEEYESILVETSFNLKVLPCEIKERIYNSTHAENDPYPYEYTTLMPYPLIEANMMRIDVKDFKWKPACVYTHSYSLDVTPDEHSIL